MWLGFATGAAFFAGITSILAKCGIKKTDSDVATMIRTIVVLACSWMMVFIVRAQGGILHLSAKSVLFLVLSGIATGASWLCYFHALQIGDVNKVVPIDKFSTVLTILLAFLLLRERMGIWQIAGILLISAGTWLMLQKKHVGKQKQPGKGWLFYALLSALFASLTSILGKVGITGVESNLGTAIRTMVVLAMAWIVLFATKKQGAVGRIDKKELCFIILSGIATGASWLCYYRALQSGPASMVVPIDKLSIVVTIAFSCLAFKEKLPGKALAGLAAIVCGTLVMLAGSG